jgi:Protein of unknown function (DUF3800)
MFYGYIDESGDDQTNLRTLSCLAGHWSQLFWFQNDWERILEEKNQELKAQGRQVLSRFHATYWSTKNEEFEGWSDKEKIEFIDKFIWLFYRYPVVGSSETLNKQDLVEVFPEALKQGRIEHLAHVVLLIYIVQYFDSRLLTDTRYATDRIAFIHDETPYKGVLRDTFEGLKNDIGIKNRDRLASIECKGWKDEILLQAADLIAYENFKVIERKQVGAEMRIPMKRILLSSKFAGRNALVTKAALQEFRDKADRPTLDLVLKYARIKPA